MCEGSRTSCRMCVVSPEDCINSRRCFMTGEQCSKQMNIHMARKELHAKDEINAFVVMNFSDMSDVVYHWRLKTFIESIQKYLFINVETREIACVESGCIAGLKKPNGSDWKPVSKINVIRADSNPASNYVICNRVCQQMQIADLIVVDTSVENTNVFYEFGMAVALGKLILPICYNESFYEHRIPANLTEQEKKNFSVKKGKKFNNFYKTDKKYAASQPDKIPLEKHMDCFPWRRRLFEYYGLRYKSVNSQVQYLNYGIATSEEYHFTDRHYACFPYDQNIEVPKNVADQLAPGWDGGKKTKAEKEDNVEVKSGRLIYGRLQKTYNESLPDENTLVIYTMDGFLNEREAPRCIINFYRNMTRQMKRMQCFRGDRVGILIQDNTIREDVKDSRAKKELPYNIGNIIHIGMNRATYLAQQERVKTEDFLPGATDYKAMAKYVQNHVGNRSLSILPDKPVYVDHAKSGLQKGVLEKPSDGEATDDKEFDFGHYYCLYHIMLRTLRYTNEIVVDISNNPVQSLFWLGAAHGSDIHAITVRYDRSEKERAEALKAEQKPERKIFDVAGLWTAVLQSHNTERFYNQIMQAQFSIEQHTKLMLEDLDVYTDAVNEKLNEVSYRSDCTNKIQDILNHKKAREARKLESYYRDYFWRRMLRYNHLHLYLTRYDESRTYLSQWDVSAMSSLSHYLSKRRVIGEYSTNTLRQNEQETEPRDLNFICIGGDAKPFVKNGKSLSLSEYISEAYDLEGPTTWELNKDTSSEAETDDMLAQEKNQQCPKDPEKSISLRKFQPNKTNSGMKPINIWLPIAEQCINCPHSGSEGAGDEQRTNIQCGTLSECPFQTTEQKIRHKHLAQMILWREVPESEEKSIRFRVSLAGVSGPSTLALTAILVDREQKCSMFGIEKDNRGKDMWYLNSLQQEIRNTFMDKFEKELSGMVGSELLTVVKMYLSTVLYRYFLPFLTREDEQSICNGMTAFLVGLRAAKPEVFEEDAEQSSEILRILEELLTSFKGVEAMYTVTVDAYGKKVDERTLVDMEREKKLKIGDQEIETVNCLFGGKKPEPIVVGMKKFYGADYWQ